MNTIEPAKRSLSRLAGNYCHEIMAETAAIFTAPVEPYGIVSVVVGGPILLMGCRLDTA